MESQEAFVALNMIEGVGPVRVRQLLEHFGDAPAILAASRGIEYRAKDRKADLIAKIMAGPPS